MCLNRIIDSGNLIRIALKDLNGRQDLKHFQAHIIQYDLLAWLLLLSRFSRVRLCNPMDGSPPGSAVPGILQARTLEWVAISFSNARKWKVRVKLLSLVRLVATPWTAAHQAPPSMGFFRQEYWSGVPLPSPNFPGSKAYLTFTLLVRQVWRSFLEKWYIGQKSFVNLYSVMTSQWPTKTNAYFKLWQHTSHSL